MKGGRSRLDVAGPDHRARPDVAGSGHRETLNKAPERAGCREMRHLVFRLPLKVQT